MWHKAIWMGHPMRLGLTRVDLLVLGCEPLHHQRCPSRFFVVTLDLQNREGERLTLGNFSISLMMRFYAEANEPPLKLRREKLVIQYILKLKSCPLNPAYVCTVPAPIKKNNKKKILSKFLRRSLMIFIIKGFRTIVFIFIVISTKDEGNSPKTLMIKKMFSPKKKGNPNGATYQRIDPS